MYWVQVQTLHYGNNGKILIKEDLCDNAKKHCNNKVRAFSMSSSCIWSKYTIMGSLCFLLVHIE